LFGYRYARTTISSPLLAFPSLQGVASLNLSGIRDTRDDVLDAKTGRFVALNLTFAPSWIGSDQDFVKGLAQAFLSVPVGKRVTWAQGYRLGLAHVFNGEPLISTEGFRAGGSSTIRGFPSDALSGGLFGAQALIVLNQELRFRSASGFGGDIDFNWRHAVGAGLRWASPFGLLRLDVGFPLARKSGEKSFRVFVSLGQAF
jgi:outer membrane translocation and assembly module TamA